MHLAGPGGFTCSNSQIILHFISRHINACVGKGDLRLSAGYLEGLAVQGNSCVYIGAKAQVQIISVPLSTEFYIAYLLAQQIVRCTVSIVNCVYYANGCGGFFCMCGKSKVAGESDQHCQNQQ